jgi:hypothetical protein
MQRMLPPLLRLRAVLPALLLLPVPAFSVRVGVLPVVLLLFSVRVVRLDRMPSVLHLLPAVLLRA